MEGLILANKYAVLLVYSNECKQRAINSFVLYSKFIIGDDCSIVIVENNSASKYKYITKGSVTHIKGDNRLSEFSGWQRGIDYISKNNVILKDDIFLFGNDTFNEHRFFSIIDSLLFKLMLSKLKVDEPIIIGEKCRAGGSFTLDGVGFNAWVSTYLFLANSAVVKSLNDTIISGDQYIEKLTDDHIYFDKERVCSNLSEHINSWLRPKDQEQHSWYKSYSNDLGLISRKAEAILNEKRLAAMAVNSKGKLYGVYDSIIASCLKRIGNSIYSRRKKL